MKKLDFIYFGLAVIMLVLYLASEYNAEERHAEQLQEIQQLDESLAKRDYLDSLTYDHLKSCSFIDREDVKVGRNGILYSQYKKYNGLR